MPRQVQINVQKSVLTITQVGKDQCIEMCSDYYLGRPMWFTLSFKANKIQQVCPSKTLHKGQGTLSRAQVLG